MIPCNVDTKIYFLMPQNLELANILNNALAENYSN